MPTDQFLNTPDAHAADSQRKIIWLASYPKSGNTWTRILLSNLLSHQGDAWNKRIELAGSISSNRPRFDNITGLPSSDMTADEIDIVRPEVYRSLAKESTDQLYIKVHDSYHRNVNNLPIFPADVSVGAILLVRDPRDVAVSYSYHSGREEFDKTVSRLNESKHYLAGDSKNQLRQILGSWSQHYLSWTQQDAITVLVVRYEDMLKDTVAALQSMAQFLGLPQADDDAKIADAVERASFDKLQAKEARDGFSEKPEKAKKFFRSGRSGEGKEKLAAELQEAIIKHHGDTMRVLGYDF